MANPDKSVIIPVPAASSAQQIHLMPSLFIYTRVWGKRETEKDFFFWEGRFFLELKNINATTNTNTFLRIF